MTAREITSAIDITNWLCKRAETEGLALQEDKIQHLLFLAQIHYALKSGHCLMPSLFVCGRSGFYEPNIRTIMEFGLPLMSSPRFDSATNDFMDLIWQKYGHEEESSLNNFVISLECWKHYYRPERDVIVDITRMTDSFAGSIKTNGNTALDASPKMQIMLSQNGPVRVSAWHPRKLSSKNKEN